MSEAKVLLVDDEPSIVKVFSAFFQRSGFETVGAATGEKALELIKNEKPDVVLLDLRLGEGLDGLETMRRIRELDVSLPVIMITAYGTVEAAVQAMKEGAFEFVCKPVDMAELMETVERAVHSRTDETSERRNSARETQLHFGTLIGECEEMQRVYSRIRKVARGKAPVLIEGESGTGKELVAKAIHTESGRSEKPWVPLNCAAIPDALLESELFGHVQGAFTGAEKERNGLFLSAHQGTLFLDEIGVLNGSLQGKLLRVLQDGMVRRIGENTDTEVDVRLVAATNETLEKMVQEGDFREDLFFRISVIPITLPPLRKRKEDIPLLLDYFCKQQSQLLNEAVFVSEDVQNALKEYHWPGNVRELQNAVACAATLCENGQIRIEDLPPRIVQGLQKEKEEADFNVQSEFENVPVNEVPQKSLQEFLKEQEHAYIGKVLEKTGGNRAKAADWLGISRATFYRKYDPC